MIIEMARIRVLGPRRALRPTLRALQDQGVVHVVDAECPSGLEPCALDPPTHRRGRHVAKALADVEAALAALARLGAVVADAPAAAPSPAEGHAARIAAHLAAQLQVLETRVRALADERDALRIYEPVFQELEQLLGPGASRPRVSAYLLLLRGADALAALRAALVPVVGAEYDLRVHALASGETIVLLLIASERAEALDRQLAAARVERAALPAGLGGGATVDALGRLRPRLAEVERELAALHDQARALAHQHGELLARARRGFHDVLLALDAEAMAAASNRAFVVEGWIPARERRGLAAALAATCGDEIAVEEIARDQAHADDAPVVLANPRLFAPFEALTSMLPLPRYGSVDPTPFVAVFFPMLFGVIVGDVGYGLLLAALALVLRVVGRREDRKALRDVARIAAAVAVYAIVFGVLYGELFGDLGARVFGMHALWFDRRESVLAFLALAIALGLVHLVLGLVVAAANRWHRDRRVAIGRGLTAVMLVLVAVGLLAVLEWLPAVLLTPAAIALLVAFPIVVILEGATALLDLMSIVGHVLSYARVMALGTASVMLAVVANRMHGAFGSAALGVAFALIFHLVNFAITLFSPTIHVMRLHYVEFFGTFFEPGGGEYRPLRHWSPT